MLVIKSDEYQDDDRYLTCDEEFKRDLHLARKFDTREEAVVVAEIWSDVEIVVWKDIVGVRRNK